ncbi:JAB domain-containing protein [Candidatus Cetobacterium colombiensis]|uniref:JAB domain-containing protein n=1 Tax=Candidatus Cetobacterium colombiensis TaxID=3073100 RepID=A0ABU4WC39_9FUSO|nr:JAB domain-containing protein [Candidatus Cetobacterium colombiensis]MDX8337106.1 JAB domain-containing protein [Candidatus Cetobacterium colombiensis]
MSILREFGGENELELKENLKYNLKESENLVSIIDYMGKTKKPERVMIKSFKEVADICEYFRDPDINIKHGDMVLLSLNANNEVENFKKLECNTFKENYEEMEKEVLKAALSEKFAKGGVLLVNDDSFKHGEDFKTILEDMGYNILDIVGIDKEDKVVSILNEGHEKNLEYSGFHKTIMENLEKTKERDHNEKEKNLVNIFKIHGYKVKNYEDIVKEIKSEKTPELKILKNTIDDFLEKKIERMRYRGDLKELTNYVRAELGEKDYEVFKVLCLDKQNNIIKNSNLFYGTIDRSAVYPREILKLALDNEAHSLIFIHNHPSGNLTPSKKDISLTQEMGDMLERIGCRLADSIVVSREGYLSMKEERLTTFSKLTEKPNPISIELEKDPLIETPKVERNEVKEKELAFKRDIELSPGEEKFIKRFLEKCEKGINPVKNEVLGQLFNPVTGKEYKGLDALVLLEKSSEKRYMDSRWLTLNEADRLGYNIKKGEKAITLEKTILRNQDGEILTKNRYEKLSVEEKVAFFKENIQSEKIRVHLFNGEQIENFPKLEKSIERDVDKLLKNIPCKIEERAGDLSYYDRAHDTIIISQNLKGKDREVELLKQFINSTSHPNRLDREHNILSKNHYKEEFKSSVAFTLLKNHLGLESSEKDGYVFKKIGREFKDKPQELYDVLKSSEKVALGVLNTGMLERDDFKDLKVKLNFSEVDFKVKDGATLEGVEGYRLLSKILLKDKEIERNFEERRNVEFEIQCKSFKSGRVRVELGALEFGGQEEVAKGLEYKFKSIAKEIDHNVDKYISPSINRENIEKEKNQVLRLNRSFNRRTMNFCEKIMRDEKERSLDLDKSIKLEKLNPWKKFQEERRERGQSLGRER